MFEREGSAGKRGKSIASDRFVASAVESPDQCVPNYPGDTSAAPDLDVVFRSRVSYVQVPMCGTVPWQNRKQF
jgi:hypothetical protein